MSRFDIPNKPPVSRIRLDLKREMADRLAADNELAALVSSDPIAAAIERYNAAAEGLRRLYGEFSGIESLLAPTDKQDGGKVVGLTKPYNAALCDLRTLYWRTLFDLPSNPRSSHKHNERRIQQAPVRTWPTTIFPPTTFSPSARRSPPTPSTASSRRSSSCLTTGPTCTTTPNTARTFTILTAGARMKLTKSAIALFLTATPILTVIGATAPTIIAPLDTGPKKTLSNIEMVLHYLDTNGAPYDSSALHNALKAAEDSGQTTKIQLLYFKATFYKKGTCHIEFTNEDVLKSFNLFACQRKGWLPPSYGKKSYNDMTPGERKVVDNYEGEASYTDSPGPVASSPQPQPCCALPPPQPTPPA